MSMALNGLCYYYAILYYGIKMSQLYKWHPYHSEVATIMFLNQDYSSIPFQPFSLEQ